MRQFIHQLRNGSFKGKIDAHLVQGTIQQGLELFMLFALNCPDEDVRMTKSTFPKPACPPSKHRLIQCRLAARPNADRLVQSAKTTPPSLHQHHHQGLFHRRPMVPGRVR